MTITITPEDLKNIINLAQKRQGERLIYIVQKIHENIHILSNSLINQYVNDAAEKYPMPTVASIIDSL